MTVDNLHGSTFRDKTFDLVVAAMLALRPAIGSGRLPRASHTEESVAGEGVGWMFDARRTVCPWKGSEAPKDLQAFKKAFPVFVDRLNVGGHACSASRD